MIQNVREELFAKLISCGYGPVALHQDIKCMTIVIDPYDAIDQGEEPNHIELKCGHSPYELQDYMGTLNQIQYNSTYGTQQLHGVIWMQDGTWFTRVVGDNTEWWEHHKMPLIPDSLR